MNPTIDKNWLFEVFKNQTKIYLNGIEGYINALQFEDGSGKCFNVKFTNGKTTFVRTN